MKLLVIFFIIKTYVRNNIFQSIYATIISNTQKSLGKGSGWIIDSAIEHNIGTSKYTPLAGNNNHPKYNHPLDHSRKALINIQNIDDSECLNMVFSQIHTSCRPYSKKNHKSF